jgi:hypothetical protein
MMSDPGWTNSWWGKDPAETWGDDPSLASQDEEEVEEQMAVRTQGPSAVGRRTCYQLLLKTKQGGFLFRDETFESVKDAELALIEIMSLLPDITDGVPIASILPYPKSFFYDWTCGQEGHDGAA